MATVYRINLFSIVRNSEINLELSYGYIYKETPLR